MTDDEGFGVVAARLSDSQREIVARWNMEQAERQRTRAEAEEAFKRDVFLPLWQEAEARITTAREALPVPFTTDWIAASWAQRLLDGRIAAAASARTLDEAQARRAIGEWVDITLAAYREFEAVIVSRRCKVCGSLTECPHDEAPDGDVTSLYPRKPARLRRPSD